MYKNQLQKLAQRSCFKLVSNSCIREEPKFLMQLVTPGYNAFIKFEIICSLHLATEFFLESLPSVTYFSMIVF